jgi:NtrC-family two-component system response regulator AlgB
MAKEFLAYFGKTNHKRLSGFTEEALQALQDHAWPGNVRELRNAVERAVILSSGNTVDTNDLLENTHQSPTSISLGDMVPLTAVEEQHIRRVLAKAASLQEAADILGIDQTTLWRRRKTYGI